MPGIEHVRCGMPAARYPASQPVTAPSDPKRDKRGRRDDLSADRVEHARTRARSLTHDPWLVTWSKVHDHSDPRIREKPKLRRAGSCPEVAYGMKSRKQKCGKHARLFAPGILAGGRRVLLPSRPRSRARR